jgi:RNA polymerase sigma factor (sigma-70 family)
MQATALSPRSLRLPSRLLRGASDERLVAALRRGDETAFEAIYDRHHGALLGFCRHMLGSHEEAEDALQRVFVSAHDHLCDGTAHVNLKPWLYTIARNRCLSTLRARRETLALDDVYEPSSDGLVLAEEVELGEDLKELLGDIARLPDDQRAALVLAELGDLSQQEIAATLDVRTDKVKALIFQAREALAGWRQARAVSCREICEQLSTLKGSALRRAPIRRHLTVCPACTAFEGEVKHQRAALALVLPVVPGVALKHSVLTAALSAGGQGAAAAGGAVAAGTAAGASGLTAKALVVAALAVSAGGGGVVAVRELEQPRPVERPAATTRAPVAAAVAAPVAGPRRLEVPALRRAAAIDSPGRKTASGQGKSKAQKARGRGRQQSAARSAPGRQRSAARSAPGRQRAAAHGAPGRERSAAAKPAPAAKPRPAPAAPATPRRPLAAKPPASKRKATPPAAAHGKSG